LKEASEISRKQLQIAEDPLGELKAIRRHLENRDPGRTQHQAPEGDTQPPYGSLAQSGPSIPPSQLARFTDALQLNHQLLTMKSSRVLVILTAMSFVLPAAHAESSDTSIPQSDSAPVQIAIPGVTGLIPGGWIIHEATPDKQVLSALDGTARVVLQSSTGPKKVTDKMFSQFAKKHLAAAKKQSAGPLASIPPMLPEFVYYGGPKSNGRIFAGYVRAAGNTIIVVEAEIDGKDPRLAMKFVSDFIQRLRFG
jgi:hypothetical protein